jgi:hypothetical protein
LQRRTRRLIPRTLAPLRHQLIKSRHSLRSLFSVTRPHTFASPCGQRAATSAFPESRSRISGRTMRAGRSHRPAMLLTANCGERFSVPNLDLRCRRWHPAKTPRVLRIASSVLHILPQTNNAPDAGAPAARGRKAAREHFSEENFRIASTHYCFASPERISQKPSRKSKDILTLIRGNTALRMNSRNPFTIATPPKHRQLKFLHPTHGESCDSFRRLAGSEPAVIDEAGLGRC